MESESSHWCSVIPLMQGIRVPDLLGGLGCTATQCQQWVHSCASENRVPCALVQNQCWVALLPCVGVRSGCIIAHCGEHIPSVCEWLPELAEQLRVDVGSVLVIEHSVGQIPSGRACPVSKSGSGATLCGCRALITQLHTIGNRFPVSACMFPGSNSGSREALCGHAVCSHGCMLCGQIPSGHTHNQVQNPAVALHYVGVRLGPVIAHWGEQMPMSAQALPGSNSGSRSNSSYSTAVSLQGGGWALRLTEICGWGVWTLGVCGSATAGPCPQWL